MNDRPRRHVLLVEDDDELRRALRSDLERLGCKVTEAKNGDEAIRAHQREQSDVVLIDLIMPGKEGVETIAELRKQYASLPLVAMSGGGVGPADTYLKLATHMGASEVLRKPFTREQMAKALGISILAQ